MVATVTFASANQPRIVAGTETIDIFQWATAATYSGGTSSTGAVHFLSLKIPHGATILDVVVYHRQDTGKLLFQGNRPRPRPRGFPADVQQIGAVGFNRLSASHRRINTQIAPPIRERVRGDIQHAHDEDALMDRKDIPPRCPPHALRWELHGTCPHGLWDTRTRPREQRTRIQEK